MEATRLKGAVVRDLHQVMVEVAGAPAVERALAALAADERREFADALAVSWVRIAVIEKVFEGVAAAAGRDVVGLNRDVNRMSADRSVRHLYRLLIRLASPEMIIRRAASAYGQVYDRGRIDVKSATPGRVVAELRDRPGMSALAREGFGIAVETVMRLSGLEQVRVLSSAHADGADYVATYRR